MVERLSTQTVIADTVKDTWRYFRGELIRKADVSLLWAVPGLIILFLASSLLKLPFKVPDPWEVTCDYALRVVFVAIAWVFWVFLWKLWMAPYRMLSEAINEKIDKDISAVAARALIDIDIQKQRTGQAERAADAAKTHADGAEKAANRMFSQVGNLERRFQTHQMFQGQLSQRVERLERPAPESEGGEGS